MESAQMAERLEQAFRTPDQNFCYYSANSVPVASPRLRALEHWDWTPYPTRGGGGSPSLVPIAFGCRPVRLDNGVLWAEPRITDYRQVADLEIPDPRSGVTGEQIRRAAELAATLPPGERVRNVDVQSPLSVAELIWSSETFYVDLLEHPDAVHELLRKITDFQIAYIRAVREAAGDRYNPCGFPLIWSSGEGTMVGDDALSLLSPAMHAEFSLPYLNELAEAVGPLYYHSCTWRASHLENIRQVRNVIAYNWNAGNSDDPAELIREFSGRAVLALHLAPGMHATRDVRKLGRNFGDEADFLEYCLDAMTGHTCFYWWLEGLADRLPVIEKIYDLLNERGYTPQAAAR